MKLAQSYTRAYIYATFAERLRSIWDRSGKISRVAAGNRIGRRLRGFPASPDISRHRSNVVEVEAALRPASALPPNRSPDGVSTGARLISNPVTHAIVQFLERRLPFYYFELEQRAPSITMILA